MSAPPIGGLARHAHGHRAAALFLGTFLISLALRPALAQPTVPIAAFPTPAVMDRPGGLALHGPNALPTPVSRLAMMADHIFPISSGEGGGFEVDAPLETGPMYPNRDARYFAFRLVFRFSAGSTLEFGWRLSGANEIAFRVVPGPCSGPRAAEERIAMKAAALLWTGREGTAAPNAEARAFLSAGFPLTWPACEPEDIDGPINSPSGTFPSAPAYAYRRHAFLVPEAVVRGGGELLERMKRSDGSSSEATVIAIRRSGVSVAVIGDSVAWGQGLDLPAKAGFVLFNTLTRDPFHPLPPMSRFFMRAHSGARIRMDNQNLIAAVSDAACEEDNGIHGEVNRPRPSIQCQVRSLARRACRVRRSQPGTVPVPSFFCDPNDQAGATGDFIEYIFDEGPRWDLVVANGCINDVGADDLILGTNGAASAVKLRAAIDTKCDFNNGLADLREFLPNAQVQVMTYHRPVTPNSDFANSGCLELAAAQSFLNDVTAKLRVETHLMNPFSRDGAAQRSADFQSRSAEVQANSVAENNARARGRGRGIIRTIDLSALFGRFSGFLAPPGATRLWPLVCQNGQYLRPVDSARGDRPGPCSQFYNRTGDQPNNVGEEICLRASAFHPDGAANREMAARLKQDLVGRRLLPLPF
jgi:hypothetical protein